MFCAITICSAKHFADRLRVARLMLEEFIESFINLYGIDYMTSNVHNLCHLVDEVELFGELASFTAYPFETTLGRLKRFLRSGNRPLAQVARRILEIEKNGAQNNPLQMPTKSQKRPIKMAKPSRNADIPQQLIDSFADESTILYSEAEVNGEFTLSALKTEDSWFFTNADTIGRILNVFRANENQFVVYAEYATSADFFAYPCSSKLLDIHCLARDCIPLIKVDGFECVRCKLVCMKYDKANEYVFVPMLHSKDSI